MTEARRHINSHDYERIAEIIKNDERMLNYLKCDSILSHKNNHLEDQRASYLSCLKNFGEIKERIKTFTFTIYQSSNEAQLKITDIQPQPELKPNRKMIRMPILIFRKT